jgi:hypothetical protein
MGDINLDLALSVATARSKPISQIQQNHARYTPEALRSSRRDQQGAATFLEHNQDTVTVVLL